RRAAAHGVDQRQGGLALGQVVAQVLAQVAAVVEHVVDQLERGAYVPAVRGQPLLEFGPPGQHRAEPRRRLEQLGGLAANHLQVARLVDVRVVGPHELQHLAPGDGVGGFGEHLHDAHVADADHHLEGARVEKVAHQHRGGVAECGVRGLASAPQVGSVDHVVVQERGGVDELDHRGELVAALAAVAERAAGEQVQRRPQALAARGDQVLRHLPDQRDVGVETGADQRVDALQVAGYRGQHGQQTHDYLIIPGLCLSKSRVESHGNPMYAVIKSGGKQYRVESGAQVRVEYLVADVGAAVA